METDLSNFHRMTIMVKKASFRKLKPKVMRYRNYKLFCNESYRNELAVELSKQKSKKNKTKKQKNFEEKLLGKFLEGLQQSIR